MIWIPIAIAAFLLWREHRRDRADEQQRVSPMVMDEVKARRDLYPRGDVSNVVPLRARHNGFDHGDAA